MSLAFARIAYPLDEAAAAIGISRSSLDLAIADGDLVPTYLGKKATKPVLRAVDLDAYVESCPTVRGGDRRAA